MIQRRDIATCIIFSIVTCGIYGIYWFIVLNDDINRISGDTAAPSGGMAFLLTLITCGIYGFYWMYKMGDKLDSVYMQRGASSDSRGVLYLILGILGLGIVSYSLMQDSLNKLIG